jgi:hypothetical protein
MQIIFNINPDQLLNAVSQLPLDEKVKIYKQLKGDLRKLQLEDILNEFKTNDISDEEINEIVEHVREEAYKNHS